MLAVSLIYFPTAWTMPLQDVLDTGSSCLIRSEVLLSEQLCMQSLQTSPRWFKKAAIAVEQRLPGRMPLTWYNCITVPCNPLSFCFAMCCMQLCVGKFAVTSDTSGFLHRQVRCQLQILCPCNKKISPWTCTASHALVWGREEGCIVSSFSV